MIVRVNVVVADVHGALLTVIVSVTVAPDNISAALKLYVGVSVEPLVIVPFVPEVLLADQEIVPLVDEYPAGTAYELLVAQTVAV